MKKIRVVGRILSWTRSLNRILSFNVLERDLLDGIIQKFLRERVIYKNDREFRFMTSNRI